ncbi:MAG TPA: glycosyltransferase family 39 protein [Bacteroidia bacterium]|nr:glycosyltransferase family 39 protein [Bacteroidia bacterium]HNS11885.1 glycosyltransferase family 39 protein [Bacteroidia bacterium]
MNSNQLTGLLLLLVCFTGYYLAWIQYQKKNFNIAVGLLVLLGLILRVYASCDFYLHFWDERYHALVAKNLINHPLLPTLYDNAIFQYDYMNWASNHVWLHKQPFPLWSMALSMQLFGCNEIALRLPSILLTSLGIFLTYSIGKYFFSRNVAIISAFFNSINGLILSLSSGRVTTDHIDSFFLFFIELSVFFVIQYVKSKKQMFNLFAGICMGISVLCKWLPGLIVIPIWLCLVLHSEKNFNKTVFKDFVKFFSLALIIFLPWQIYILARFPQEAAFELGFNIRHLTETIETHTGSIFYYFNKLRINYGELVYLPLIWLIYSVYKADAKYKLLSLAIWIFVPLIVFSFAQTKMQAYIAFIAPAIFIVTAAFIEYLKELKIEWKIYKTTIKLIILALVVLPIRYTIERLKPLESKNRIPENIIALKKISNVYNNAIMFNYDDPISAMFYTNMTVYSFIPDQQTIDSLKNNGYKILISSVVEPDTFRLENVEVIHLASMK